MVSWELDDWITNAGDAVVSKKVAKSYDALDLHEQLLYEIWLFDTQAQNGGVSQYFCNTERDRWQALLELCVKSQLPYSSEFAEQIELIVLDVDDRYQAVINSEVDLDGAYQQCRGQIISELRAFVESVV